MFLATCVGIRTRDARKLDDSGLAARFSPQRRLQRDVCANLRQVEVRSQIPLLPVQCALTSIAAHGVPPAKSTPARRSMAAVCLLRGVQLCSSVACLQQA